MQHKAFIQGLLEYLAHSTTPYHAAANAARMLSDNGFLQLDEGSDFTNLEPGSYFVSRNDSSLIAFTLASPTVKIQGLRMAGSHTDSPCLKVKPNPLLERHSTLQLGVEVYGGALLNPWFDRDLSLAGRICRKDDQGMVKCETIDYRRPVAVIPSLAIHLDREANTKRSINKQTDLIPIIKLEGQEDTPQFTTLLEEQLVREHPDAKGCEILDYDLFLYDSQPPQLTGWNEEFITGARLDNLLSCYVLLRALITTTPSNNALIVLNDHEEVGSVSTAGAQGPFLRSLLERIFPEPNQRTGIIHNSLLISADNAHGVHPNYADKYDANHLPGINQGPVIKKNANHRYASDAYTASLFKLFCKEAGVPYQEFVMRNDMACGSTIGPLTASMLGVPTVDVGVPSLAMHSIRETAGTMDCWYLYKTLSHFFHKAPGPFHFAGQA